MERKNSPYPQQIVSAVKSINGDAWMFAINQEFGVPGVSRKGEDEPYMQLFSGWSTFALTILKKTKSAGSTAVTANIRLNELPLIRERADFILGKYLEQEYAGSHAAAPAAETEENGAAESASSAGVRGVRQCPLKMGEFRGRTPLDVVQENPDNLNRLLFLRDKVLEPHKDQYRANALQIDAINEAAELLHAGKLAASLAGTPGTGSSGTDAPVPAKGPFLIYKSPAFKYKTAEDEHGRHVCYSMSIEFDLNRTSYPVRISITNEKAALKESSRGTKVVNGSTAVDQTTLVYNLSVQEWTNVLHTMQMAEENFRATHYREMEQKANRAVYEAISAAKRNA
jgi:hypothetical protein